MATALTSLLTRFTDKCNRVLAGGVVKTYEPNSLTPKLSYQDPEGTIPNLPEVVLDETGRAKIYLLGDYRVQVYSNDGVLIEDNLLVEQTLVQRDFDNLSTDIQQQVDEAKQAFENTGGFISAPTLTALQAITPEYDYQLARVDATGDEYRWNPALTTTVKWEPTGRNFLSESKAYADSLAGNLKGLNATTEFPLDENDEYALVGYDLVTTDSSKRILHYLKDGILHFVLPVKLDGNTDTIQVTLTEKQFLEQVIATYTLENTNEYDLNQNLGYVILDSNRNILFSTKTFIELINQVNALLNISDTVSDLETRVENLEDNPTSNPYVAYIENGNVFIQDTRDFSTKKLAISYTANSPRQLLLDSVVWDTNVSETPVMYSKKPFDVAYPLSPRKRLVAWGHSFVENPIMMQKLYALTSLPTYNFGKSGTRSFGIAARHNSPSFKYKPSTGLIPASGSVTLTAASSDYLWAMFGFSAATVTSENIKGSLAGIDGSIAWDGTNLTFTREASGSAVTVSDYTDYIVKPYTTVSSNYVNKDTLYTQHDECINILWLGRNNISSFDQIMSDYNTIITSLKTLSKKVVVLPEFYSSSETTGTAGHIQVDAINTALKAKYPDFYCEIGGVSLLQNFINHHNPAYADDVTDVTNGTTPRTLRYDGLHPSLSLTPGASGASPYATNALHMGAEVNAQFIYQFLQNKGWI